MKLKFLKMNEDDTMKIFTILFPKNIEIFKNFFQCIEACKAQYFLLLQYNTKYKNTIRCSLFVQIDTYNILIRYTYLYIHAYQRYNEISL